MWYDLLLDKLEEHLRKCPKHKPEYHSDEMNIAFEHFHYESWKHGEEVWAVCPWYGCNWKYAGKLVLCLDIDSVGEVKEDQ